MSKLNKNIFLKVLLAIFLFSLFLIISFPFFSNKLISGHDTEVHGVRLANYYLAIKQNQFPPQWAPNMHHGFGYPVFMYSYHLPYILGQISFVLTKSIEISLNSLYILSIFLAVYGTYFLAKIHKANWKIGILATLVYSLSPYFLLAIYIRGAVATALFLGLLPLVLAFLTNPKENSFFYKTVLFLLTCSILLSHHIAFLVFLPLVVGFIFFNLIKPSTIPKKVLLSKVKIIIFAVLSTGFYWIPALLSSNLIKVIGADQTFSQMSFLKVQQLLWNLWDCKEYCYANIKRPLPTFLGFASISILVVSVFSLYFKKIQNKHKNQMIFWLVVSLISIFFMLNISFYFWHILPVISMIQFPWLLLWVPTIASVFCLFYLEKIILHKKTSSIILLTIILSQSLFALLYWKPQPNQFKKSYNDWIQFGDIMKNYDGLIPKNFDTHKNLKLYKDVIIRLDGNKTYENLKQEHPNQDGDYQIIKWTGSHKKYIVNATQSASVIQKTTYFPGWHATVDQQEVKIITNDSEFPGRIIIPIQAGEHIIETSYKSDSIPQIIGKFITMIGIFGVLRFLWLNK